MVEFIPLERLASKEKINFLEKIESNKFLVTNTKIRDVYCKYYTASKRQLWQAVGLEYIESELLDYIDDIKKGSIFYDIGASNGIFSVYAARKGLNVFSFEPEIQNFSLLGMNSYLNSKSIKHQIKIFNIALSDTDEMGNMYIAKYEAGGHMKILDKPKKVQEYKEFIPDFVQNILKFSLDNFIKNYGLPFPEYIKIDVDGAEKAVICGADEVLKNSKLKSIFIELDDGKSITTDIINIIKSYDFKENKKFQVQNNIGLYNYVFLKI